MQLANLLSLDVLDLLAHVIEYHGIWRTNVHDLYRIYLTASQFDSHVSSTQRLGLLRARNLRPPEQTENVVYILAGSLTQTEGSLARSNSLEPNLFFHEL